MAMATELLVDAFAFTLALLALFEGMRRIGSGRGGRVTATLLVVGAILCGLRIGLSFVIASAQGDMAQAHRNQTFSELRPDWGAELSALEKAKSSRAYAAAAFKDTGR